VALSPAIIAFLGTCAASIRRTCEAALARETENEDRQRILRLAGRTRETMTEFLERATQEKIDRLSALITESFRLLLRKQTLVERIPHPPVHVCRHALR